MPETDASLTYSEAVDELAKQIELVGNKSDLAIRVRRIFVEQPNKLVRAVLKTAAAESTMESEILFKPSKLFLELLAAVRARDIDKIGILEHDFRS